MRQTKPSLHSLSRRRAELFGLCTLWILLFHAQLCEVRFAGVFRLLKIGNMGVDIFLFLSGMGLYFSYSRDGRPGAFFRRRLIRLGVPVAVICGGYWIYQYIIGECDGIGLLLRASLLNFWITGDQQIWFVSFIALAYGLYPLIHRYIYGAGFRHEQLMRTLVLVSLSVLLMALVRRFAPGYYDKVDLALARFPAFIVGCWFGRAVFEKRALSPGALALAAAAVLVSFAAIVFRESRLSQVPEGLLYLPGAVGLAVLLAELFDEWPLTPVNAALRWLGERSLECYLVQIILIRLYRQGALLPYRPGSFPRYAAILAATVILAAAAHWAEARLIRRLRPDNRSIE